MGIENYFSYILLILKFQATVNLLSITIYFNDLKFQDEFRKCWMDASGNYIPNKILI